nr:hypothetical protein [Candidatus Freyarchaeota archaeon]
MITTVEDAVRSTFEKYRQFWVLIYDAGEVKCKRCGFCELRDKKDVDLQKAGLKEVCEVLSCKGCEVQDACLGPSSLHGKLGHDFHNVWHDTLNILYYLQRKLNPEIISCPRPCREYKIDCSLQKENRECHPIDEDDGFDDDYQYTDEWYPEDEEEV